MKKTSLLLLILLLCGNIFAQQNDSRTTKKNDQKLLGILNYNAYNTDNQQPYIEFQFIIDGGTAKYIPASDDTYAAEIEITVDIRKKEDDKEVDVNKLHYILVSPQTRDSVSPRGTLFSDMRNVAVPNGDYYLYFTLKDIHGNSDTVHYVDFIQVHFPEDRISLSGISLYERLNGSGEGGVFFKYNFAITPLFMSYAPETVNTLPFTMEIYNTEKVLGKGKNFIVKAELAEVGRIPDPTYTVYRTMPTAPVSIFLHLYSIFKLPSGNYNLNIYVMNEDSTVLATASTFFQRSNPRIKFDVANYDNVVIERTFVEDMTDINQMREDVACLYPIGSYLEQDFFNQSMKKVPLEQLQRYFYSFWLARNPNDPEGAWLAYKAKVDYVNETYGSSVIKGFRTDRGRVYLKYGPPTSITEEPYDPQAYPYEIWHYYVLGEQTNVKFIFYNRDLVTNNYELLHSDYLGEIQDPGWQMKLVRRLNPSSNPDITTPDDYWGGHAREYYRYNRQ